MAVATAVARDVHGSRHEAGVLERLVDRHRARREMARVHVEDRIEQRLRQPGRAQRREGGAVLDDPPLLPAPPDERGDVVHARPGACRDRRQADGRQGREDRGREPVVAVLGEEGQGRRAAALDRALERRRGHPVHDDEHELRSHAPGLLVPRERPQTGVPLGTRTPQQRHESQEHERNEYPTAGIQASAATTIAAPATSAPCRLACRRAGAHRSRSALRRALRRGRPRFRRRGHPSRPAASSRSQSRCRHPRRRQAG